MIDVKETDRKIPPNEDWRSNEKGILLFLAIIAVIVGLVFLVIGGVKSSNEKAIDSGVKNWKTDGVIYLQSFSEEQLDEELKNYVSDNDSFIIQSNSDKMYKYSYSSMNGINKIGSVSLENSTVYEKDDIKKPRIVIEKCFLKDPKNDGSIRNYNPKGYDGKECDRFHPTPDRIKIYVPKDSVLIE